MLHILRYSDGTVSDDFSLALKFDGTKLEKDENTVVFDRSRGKNYIWSKKQNQYVLLSTFKQ